MNCHRYLIIAWIVILCVGFFGCSKTENEHSASVSVALEDKTKELPRLEQNFIYEKSLDKTEKEPFYFHESPDPLTPASEDQQKKSEPATV